MSRRLPAVIGLTLVLVASVRAAAPKLDAVHPAGGRRGETNNSVLFIGKVSDWPVKPWCSHPGIRIEAGKEKNSLRIAVDADVPAGPHLLRFFNEDGASDAKTFVVGDLPEVTETASNDSRERAEAIESLPVTVNGRLERGGDTDFYRVKLRAGQLLTARLDGYSLGSEIDPFISLFDPRGYEIAVASDTHNLDPFLQHRIEKDGEYYLQVFAIAHKASTSVAYAGSASAVYRMRVSTDESERLGLPLASDAVEEDGAKLKFPVRVAGELSEPGESDEFTFTAKKGEQYAVRVEARRWRYLWDPVLSVHRPDGRLLREVDDSRSSADAEYTFKATQDGEHKITIADRFRSGGPEHRYRLVIEGVQPLFSATVDKDRWVMKPGKEVELKLKLDRQDGHKAALSVRFENLPQGVTAEAKEIAGKDKAATVKLKAAADAPPFNGPIRLLLKEEAGDPVPVTWSFLTGDSRGDYLVNETAVLWLTVTEAGKPAKK